jgi:hypothetical protein
MRNFKTRLGGFVLFRLIGSVFEQIITKLH